MAVFGPLLVDGADPVLLAAGHLAALAALWAAARSADPADQAEFTRFYMRVWLLFFLEYAHRSRFLLGRIGRSYGH